MVIDWNKITQKDLYKKELYDKIIQIEDIFERSQNEVELFNTARKFKCVTVIQKAYEKYKKQVENDRNSNLYIDFGENAPIRKMLAPGYFKDKKNNIRTYDKNVLVTATPIQPIKILKNQETGEEFVKCVFLKKGKWHDFSISREILMNNGKITQLAKKGVDVSSSSSTILVGYIRDLLNNNELPEVDSTCKMGWHENVFLPYDNGVEYDGDEEFKPAFTALSSKGNFEDWKNEIGKLRTNNTVLKMVMGTSFASPLLSLLHRQSFVTHLWGKSGGKKSVAGRIAMSIWGDSEKGKLMFMMDNSASFFYRVSSFLNNIPGFFDELQTYKYDVNKLIMNLTEGIDRGKAKAEGGIQAIKTWNNAFIFTGEDAASSYNSGGGTLNRLIQIYITKDVVEDGMGICDFLADNYGTAGKVFIDYVKKIGVEQIDVIFKEKYNAIMSYDKTEEKQAINMAMILLADELACRCIFTDETPLTVENVLGYMFTKSEIDNTERAYKTFLDVCIINRKKFSVNGSEVFGEYWGIVDDFEISIISKKLQDIMEDNKFNYGKVLRDWEEKGLIEKKSSGKYSIRTTKIGIKANYVVVKLKNQDEDEQVNIEEFKKVFNGVQLDIKEE